MHYTLYTIHYYTLYTTIYYTLYTSITIHYILYTMHYTLYTLHYILYSMHYTLYTIHYILYTMHYTLYTIYYALYTIHYILYSMHYALYTIHYTLYTTYDKLVSFTAQFVNIYVINLHFWKVIVLLGVTRGLWPWTLHNGMQTSELQIWETESGMEIHHGDSKRVALITSTTSISSTGLPLLYHINITVNYKEVIRRNGWYSWYLSFYSLQQR